MFKKLKYKFDRYINEENVGKKVNKDRNIYPVMKAMYGDLWSRIFMYQLGEQEETSTGIYARLEKLEEHLSSLEKHLGVEFYKDKKEVTGFKSIKKSKKNK